MDDREQDAHAPADSTSNPSMPGVGELCVPRAPAARMQRGWRIGLAVVGGILAAGIVAAVLVPPADTPATVPDEAPAPRATRFDAHLVEAEQAMEARQWSQALRVIGLALDLALADPERIRRAVRLKERVRRERANQDVFARFRTALAQDDLEDIRRHYADIPRDSVYFLDAELDYRELRGARLDRVRTRAEGLVERGACGALDERIAEAERTFPGARAELADLSTRCTARRQRPPAAHASESRDTSEPRNASDASESRNERTARPLDGPARLRAIQRATRRGQYRRVLRLCAQGLHGTLAPTEAATLCGLAACRTGKGSLARQYHRGLPPARQAYVVQTCLKHDITFGP